jgi:hypothetical protein
LFISPDLDGYRAELTLRDTENCKVPIPKYETAVLHEHHDMFVSRQVRFRHFFDMFCFDQPGNRTGSAGSSAPSVDAGGQKAWRRAAEHTHRQEEAAGSRRDMASGLLSAGRGAGMERGASSARAWGRPGAEGRRGVTVMLVVVLGRRGGEGSFQVGGMTEN